MSVIWNLSLHTRNIPALNLPSTMDTRHGLCWTIKDLHGILIYLAPGCSDHNSTYKHPKVCTLVFQSFIIPTAEQALNFEFRNFATDVGSILSSNLSLIKASSPAMLSVEITFIHTVLAIHLIPQSHCSYIFSSRFVSCSVLLQSSVMTRTEPLQQETAFKRYAFGFPWTKQEVRG